MPTYLYILFSGDGRPSEGEPDCGPNRNATDRRRWRQYAFHLNHGRRHGVQRCAFRSRAWRRWRSNFDPGHQHARRRFGRVDTTVRGPADRNSRGWGSAFVVPAGRRRWGPEPYANFRWVFSHRRAHARLQHGEHGVDAVRRTAAGPDGAQTRCRLDSMTSISIILLYRSHTIRSGHSSYYIYLRVTIWYNK